MSQVDDTRPPTIGGLLPEPSEEALREFADGMARPSADERGVVPLRRLDPIETLISLIESHCDDFLLSNGGRDPNVPAWYALGYWRDADQYDPEGGWEIDVIGLTLREVLIAFIGHERFGS